MTGQGRKVQRSLYFSGVQIDQNDEFLCVDVRHYGPVDVLQLVHPHDPAAVWVLDPDDIFDLELDWVDDEKGRRMAVRDHEILLLFPLPGIHMRNAPPLENGVGQVEGLDFFQGWGLVDCAVKVRS